MSAAKRQHERKDTRALVRLMPLEFDGRFGAELPGVMVDISRGGARVVVRRMLHQEGTAVLTVPNQSGDFARVVEIRQVHYEPGIGYALGLQFRTDADAEKILQRAQRHKPARTRAA